MGRTDFSDQLMIRYKCIGYNSDIRLQSACLVINPITIVNFAATIIGSGVILYDDSDLKPFIFSSPEPKAHR